MELYLIPKTTARQMHLGGSRSVTPHPVSKEVWGNQTQLKECTKGKRQVGDTGSKLSYQGKVNVLPSEVAT